ncbi:BsuPI-related putative proteinase inhibitor [Salinilacihabitans rarus]|uniref:BsuPI-related putative proteinase inhibitor n=1 Tax=Salinilacihabitans rarus TaxID=2961596 RepID=UPI0020C8C847|nr:BsuPI-related putative proteinase inhibitor [Salinilacihabitans rarus]
MPLEGTLDATVDGDAPRLQFSVTNVGDEPVELRFPDACKAEFVVEADDEEVWRFTEGRMFAQVLGSETLDAGETATYEADCDALDPGRYVARAELRARNEDCEASTTLTV